MTVYHKLVRDKIPEIIKKKGGTPVTHIADEKEYQEKLYEKFREEVEEFLSHRDPEELADVLEVCYAVCELQGLDPAKLEELRKKKAEERGGFKERIILEES